MDIDLRALKPEERHYVFSQSQQLSMQTGLIGHLRADMDSNGTGFFSTWFGFNEKIKTDEFKAEFDDVLNAFRFDKKYDGILGHRDEMKAYCRNHPESAMEGSYSTEYGFRADTENYAYLMRLNPIKGDYNLYCWCYKRDWLDQHLEKAQKGIRFITPDCTELFRIADGDKVRITTNNGEMREMTCRYIDETHLETSSGRGTNLYHIYEFAEKYERNHCQSIVPLRSSLPESCYSTLLDTGMIVILKRGETGYYPTDIPYKDKAEAREIVDEMNSMGGVTKAQAEAMRAGSMFGFACPAADPKNYDENGTPIRPQRRDRGDAR